MQAPSTPTFRPRPYRAPPWARNPHVQTLAGKTLRPTIELELTRERWETPDGDFLDLDLAADPAPDAPLVLILHGLEGSSRRRYVLSVHAALRRTGMRGIALNFRGCSGEPNRTPRAYHSGETGDPALVLERLRDRFPDRRLGALGISLGGNILLKLLGERGEEARALLGAAVAVSVPYDLDAGARKLETTLMGRIYSAYFLRSLRSKTRAKTGLLRDRVDLPRALASRTIRAFDDALTAPLHGFRDAKDYYRRCSSAAFLPRIRVPTLLVHATDDPFLPADAVPAAAVEANPWLVAAFSERGGHVGFALGPPWAPHFYAEREAVRFLAGELSEP